jgi:hypothetical protein
MAPPPSSDTTHDPQPQSLPNADPEHERESLTQLLTSFQKSVQGQWSSVQLEWKEERERLAKAREEFEGKMNVLENDLAKVASFQQTLAVVGVSVGSGNGEAVGVKKVKGGGLVTPPSPRSLSSDSSGGGGGGRRRRRRSRSGSSRGRGRSGSQSTSTTAVSVSEAMEGKRPYTPEEDGEEEEEEGSGSDYEHERRRVSDSNRGSVDSCDSGVVDGKRRNGVGVYPTPDPSTGNNSLTGSLVTSPPGKMGDELTDAVRCYFWLF